MANDQSLPNVKFKVNDRVRRANGQGCNGTVRELRTDVTASSADQRDRSVMVNVLWDNGTQSSMAPDSLVEAE